MSESETKSFLTSPWGILSIVGNALGIGNFQENYLPQLIRWKEFFSGIFEVVDRIAQFCLIPLERAVSFIFRLPDWEFPQELGSYFLLNAVLLSALTRVVLVDHFNRGHSKGATWQDKLKAGVTIPKLIASGVIVSLLVFTPGLVIIFAAVVTMKSEDSMMWGWMFSLFYGVFSLACLPVMISDFRGFGQMAGIVSAVSLYLIIMVVGAVNVKKNKRREILIQLVGGPALFIVLAFIFS